GAVADDEVQRSGAAPAERGGVAADIGPGHAQVRRRTGGYVIWLSCQVSSGSWWVDRYRDITSLLFLSYSQSLMVSRAAPGAERTHRVQPIGAAGHPAG